jgi:pimeloyl-ACP methyl ester carboxylesterase
MSGPNIAFDASRDAPHPVLVYGGLGGGSEFGFLYKPLLNDGLDWELPPEDRYIPLPNRGLGDPQETIKRLEEITLSKVQKLGGRVVLVGHSLGAWYGEEVILDNPEAATDVVLAAGAHDGKKYETASSLAIRHILMNPVMRYLLGNPDITKHINHDSELMQEHRERMATQWPDDVGLHAVNTTFDYVLPFMHGLNIELPNDGEAEASVITLPLPGMESMLRLLGRNPNIKHLSSIRPAFHTDIIRHPMLINYVRDLQYRSPQVQPEDHGSNAIYLDEAA